jgi:hypothetical protein
MKARIFFPVLVILLVQTMRANSQQNTLTDPPYLAHSSNFVMMLFNLEQDVVQTLLPPGVKAKINTAGTVTAGIEIYETDRIHGVSQYGIVFIFVEVADLESNNGTPGHWAIWGKVNQKNTLQSMLHYFNFPYSFDEIKVTKEDNTYTATVGTNQIKLKLRYNEKQPFAGEGVVNMCSASKDGKIIKTEVPWFSTGSAAELISFEVDPRGNTILEIIKKATPHFSLISTNQSFSYSRPVTR